MASWSPARITTVTPGASARAVMDTAMLSSSSLATAATARLRPTPSLIIVRRIPPSPMSTGMPAARAIGRLRFWGPARGPRQPPLAA